jgi:prolyl oligopeptidase PreP (S9A serine peptidase family)
MEKRYRWHLLTKCNKLKPENNAHLQCKNFLSSQLFLGWIENVKHKKVHLWDEIQIKQHSEENS